MRREEKQSRWRRSEHETPRPVFNYSVDEGGVSLKRDKLDAVVSELVRERANWTCEHCGTEYSHERRQGLHCSHLWSRRSVSTRWHPDNLFAHCYGCHQRLGGNPVAFRDWALKQLGGTRFDELTMRAHKPIKYTKADKEEMYQHYKKELERLKKLRKEGKTGYLEFVAYD